MKMQKDLATIKAEFERLMEDFDMGMIGNADIVNWFLNDVLTVIDGKEDEGLALYNEREKLLEPLANKICEKVRNL